MTGGFYHVGEVMMYQCNGALCHGLSAKGTKDEVKHARYP